jgi:hypothetical protein
MIDSGIEYRPRCFHQTLYSAFTKVITLCIGVRFSHHQHFCGGTAEAQELTASAECSLIRAIKPAPCAAQTVNMHDYLASRIARSQGMYHHEALSRITRVELV